MSEPYRFWGDEDKSYYEILMDRIDDWKDNREWYSAWHCFQEFILGRYNFKYWENKAKKFII